MTDANTDTRSEDANRGSPSLEDRLRGAVWGQFIGDAACLGSHWIYNLADLQRTFPEGLKGFEAPAEGHYHRGKVPGDQTHYGDAALLLLESVAGLTRFDPIDFGSRFVGRLGSPEYKGYIDSASRGTLEAYQVHCEEHPGRHFGFQNGADDDQLATASRLVPVVLAHFCDARLFDMVAAATRVCQNNPRAIAYMRCHALILRELFSGRDVHSALHRVEEFVDEASGFAKEILRKIRGAFQVKHLSVTDATLQFGQSCPLICSFPAAVHTAVKYPDRFSRAVLATAAAGGDSAGRASMIGAWLGAYLGQQGIPLAWRRRLNAGKRIEKCLDRLLTDDFMQRAQACVKANKLEAGALNVGTAPKLSVHPQPRSIAATIRGNGFGRPEKANSQADLKAFGLKAAVRILRLQEGFEQVTTVESRPDIKRCPFQLFGFRDRLPYIIAVKTATSRFIRPADGLVDRLLALTRRIDGLNVAFMQIKLDRGTYRIFYKEAFKFLAADLKPVERWLRQQLVDSE
jgi:ADP-ribosylglycohydrolase